MHIRRSGTLELPTPPRQALALFTAEGERGWVPGWDPDDGITQYGRFTPGQRVGTVEVRCDPRPSGGSRVTVTYALTALSDEAARELETLTPEAYRAMLVEWQERLMDLVTAGESDVVGEHP